MMSIGMPIFAASSIPRTSPRERMKTLSAKVRVKKNSACSGRAKIDSASTPR